MRGFAGFVRTIFKGYRDGASLGRVCFLVMMGFCLWHWGNGRQTPEHAFYFLMALMGYVFGSKIVSTFGPVKMESDRGLDKGDGGKG